MKAYLALISAAALALSACGGEKPAETPPAPPAASAEAPASAASEAPASEASEPAAAASEAPASEAAAPAAGACETVVESDDMMNFNTKELVIDKTNCKEFKVTLKHTGKMPKTAMGHNIVISKAQDTKAVIADGASAGADGDYVKAGDERVIAYTKLIGGGEETSVTVDTSKLAADGKYEFYCSFPAHAAQMIGHVTLK
ncbi:Azurin iso-1 precursor [Kingella potus]|uniref:Azurin iso-1 n=1 Tax=Kingella potus TaxID=265175 RepID=A0A377R285_9NEIS|nr:azurin [Kingella potus]UOP00342.1 azurin [Kingella potus]STR02601.1 Azurin iso-1 precursor [Kingella potus]